MDDRFYTAFFPGEATVCGQRLKSFSTFHYLTLSAIESPFLQGDGVIRPADLMAAVRICQLDYGNSPSISPTIRDLIRIRRMNKNEDLFQRECAAFSVFMSSHCSGPRFWNQVEGGQKFRELTGPEALIPVTSAMLKLGITEENAWNMSMGRLQWYNAQTAELEGSERRFLDQTNLKETDRILTALEQKQAMGGSHA